MPQLCAMILQQSPAPIREVRADVPEGLEQVILHCMEKDRTRRFATVAELANALLPYAPRRARASVERISRVISGEAYVAPSSVTSLSEAPAALAASAPGTQASWGNTGVKRGNGAWFVVAGLGVALVAGGAFAALEVLHKGSVRAPSASASEPAVAVDLSASRPAAATAPSAFDQMTIRPIVPESASVAPAAATAAPAASHAPLAPHVPQVVAHSAALRAASKPPPAPPNVPMATVAPAAGSAVKPKNAIDLYDDRK
jgi:serine/threonine-protein kinase